MGERAKVILNEYSAKNLLMRDTLDLDKFYTADLKLFVEVARKEIDRLNNIIKEVREYIENNDLYEQDYDYDYEENLVVGPPSDETARKILLGILDKGE